MSHTPSPAREWYASIDGVEFGPLTVPELKRMASSGQLLPTHFVKKGEGGKLVSASKIKGLSFVSPNERPIEEQLPSAKLHVGSASSSSKNVPPWIEDQHASESRDVGSATDRNEEWLIQIDGVDYGPITVTELKRMAESGKLLPCHLVRKENEGAWVSASTIKGLSFSSPAEKPRDEQVPSHRHLASDTGKRQHSFAPTRTRPFRPVIIGVSSGFALALAALIALDSWIRSRPEPQRSADHRTNAQLPKKEEPRIPKNEAPRTEELLRDAEAEVARMNTSTAAKLLREYLSDSTAKEKGIASVLLSEIELATSEEKATQLLVTLSPEELNRFRTTGKLKEVELIANQSLRPIYSRTLQAAMSKLADNQAEEQKRRQRIIEGLDNGYIQLRDGSGLTASGNLVRGSRVGVWVERQKRGWLLRVYNEYGSQEGIEAEVVDSQILRIQEFYASFASGHVVAYDPDTQETRRFEKYTSGKRNGFSFDFPSLTNSEKTELIVRDYYEGDLIELPSLDGPDVVRRLKETKSQAFKQYISQCESINALEGKLVEIIKGLPRQDAAPFLVIDFQRLYAQRAKQRALLSPTSKFDVTLKAESDLRKLLSEEACKATYVEFSTSMKKQGRERDFEASHFFLTKIILSAYAPEKERLEATEEWIRGGGTKETARILRFLQADQFWSSQSVKTHAQMELYAKKKFGGK